MGDDTLDQIECRPEMRIEHYLHILCIDLMGSLPTFPSTDQVENNINASQVVQEKSNGSLEDFGAVAVKKLSFFSKVWRRPLTIF